MTSPFDLPELLLTRNGLSYTKVLDEIKRIRKEQTVDIKVDKEKLSALKTDRDRAYKVGALGPAKFVWEV